MKRPIYTKDAIDTLVKMKCYFVKKDFIILPITEGKFHPEEFIALKVGGPSVYVTLSYEIGKILIYFYEEIDKKLRTLLVKRFKDINIKFLIETKPYTELTDKKSCQDIYPKGYENISSAPEGEAIEVMWGNWIFGDCEYGRAMRINDQWSQLAKNRYDTIHRCATPLAWRPV